MNTVGKILVILNFLFALIVGGLVVAVAATSNRWKEAYDALKIEAKVLELGRQQDVKMRPKVASDLRESQLLVEKLTRDIEDQKVKISTMDEGHRLEIATLQNNVKEALITQAQAQAASKRLTEEVANLGATLKEREILIVKLDSDVKTARTRAQNFESLEQAGRLRNQSLTDELRKITLAFNRLEAGVNPDSVVIRTNDPNPPPVKVEGKIEKVDGDLVLISLGTDHGVNKNNTLDVFRLQPESKYLGMVRIVEAKEHTSVARLIPSGNQAFRPQLKIGDVVSSKIR